MLYLLLTVEYDGYDYSGWVKQKNAKTIQGELEKAFFRICQQEIWTLGASKTDAGVHASNQKVLIKIPFIPKSLSFFIKTVSKSLPSSINIKSFEQVAENFNVRNSKQKEYVYTINDHTYDLFNHRYELKIDEILNIHKLHRIAQIFVGTHDFAFFSGVKTGEAVNTIRTISKIWVKRSKTKKIKIHFQAKGFVRYQIRMIVQNILECYFAKISIFELEKMLNDPPKGLTTKHCAKGYGLCLKTIKY